MKLLITGVTGFLGSALAHVFIADGHTVSGTSSRAIPDPSPGIKLSRLVLGDQVETGLSENVDYVIHCAHDFRRGALKRNVEGTKRIFEQAASDGASQQAFVSSYSATSEAQTEYAIAKFELERFFLERNATVFKPGLVLGARGLGGRLLQTMRKAWIFPAPGSDASFPYIGLKDFVQTVKTIVLGGQAGEHKLYYPAFTNFRALAKAVRAETGRPFVILPFPLDLALFGLSVIEFVCVITHVSSPVFFDSFKTLKANQLISGETGVETFPESYPDLQQTVSAALRDDNRKRNDATTAWTY